LETIGDHAFSKCSVISVFKCSPNVKTIEKRAFYECTKLQDVDLSKAKALQSIGERAFEGSILKSSLR